MTVAEYNDPNVRIKELERIVRCSLRAFAKYLNTTETRIIKRAAKRLEIKP